MRLEPSFVRDRIRINLRQCPCGSLECDRTKRISLGKRLFFTLGKITGDWRRRDAIGNGTRTILNTLPVLVGHPANTENPIAPHEDCTDRVIRRLRSQNRIGLVRPARVLVRQQRHHALISAIVHVSLRTLANKARFEVQLAGSGSRAFGHEVTCAYARRLCFECSELGGPLRIGCPERWRNHENCGKNGEKLDPCSHQSTLLDTTSLTLVSR